MTHHMTIAIAGAGIGGLAAASLLFDQGHNVTVFDQFSEPQPVGSGLVIQPVGQDVLAQIGIAEAVIAKGAKITQMIGHEAVTKRPVLNVRYDPHDRGVFGLGIHRATLFSTLWQAAYDRGIRIVPGAQVAAAARGQISLTDGTRHGPFDLIIDAAGAASPLSPLVSRPLPFGAIWGTVDWPDTSLSPTKLQQSYRRASHMIGVLPIGTMPGETTPKAAVFWSMPATAYEAWRTAGLDAWRQEATALWPEFAPFAAQITDPDQMTMARYTHGTLRKPFGPGIAHIGDAAHRASPQLGQGANMALLDAQALTQAIRLANGQDPMHLYAQARRAHVMAYQLSSWAFTPMYQSDSRILPWLRNRILYPASQLWPISSVLTGIICGTMLPPLGSLNRT